MKPRLRENWVTGTASPNTWLWELWLTHHFIPELFIELKDEVGGTSLVVQWVRLRAPNAGGPGLFPGQGTRSHMSAATKSSHATTKEPACCN